MKIGIAFLTVALTCLAGRGFTQTGSTAAAAGLRSGIPASDGELTTGVVAFIENANQIGSSQAVSLYRAAVKLARAEGHLPSFTSWRLSNRYFADGDTIRAARVLDDLAKEAAEQGDIGIQALATFYSAWLHGRQGHGSDFASRMTKVHLLLQSQYMPVAVRDEINDRLNGSSRFAKNQ